MSTETPQLFVVSSHRPRNGLFRPTAEQDCPRSPPVDRDAVPDFPLFGSEGAFSWVAPAGANVTLCALIGADGRVWAVFVAAGSGERRLDRALVYTIRGLPFEPAERWGAPVPAWHRLILNRGRGVVLASSSDECLC